MATLARESLMHVFVAHAGHWLVSVAYFLPVVGFLIWLAVTQWRERRGGKRPG